MTNEIDKKTKAQIISAFEQLTVHAATISKDQRITATNMLEAIHMLFITTGAALCVPGKEDVFVSQFMDTLADNIIECRDAGAGFTLISIPLAS